MSSRLRKLTYLAVFGSVVSFLLYLWLLGRWTANRTSLITLLTPVVAVAAGVVYLGERLTPLQAAGALAVLAGVGLSLWTKRVPAPPAETAAVPGKKGREEKA